MLLFIVGSAGALFAQNVITGVVTSGEDGSTMPGVNVVVKGTTSGTTTDIDGKYKLAVPENSKSLEFSFIGFNTLTVDIDGKSVVNVIMQPGNLNLDEVVVTALGISKEKKSLAYSTQQVKTDELTAIKEVNPINALNGKVAGMTINKSASGTGGSTRITLRGNKSTRNNQPLYVIDGVPMLNYSPQQPGSVWGGTNANGSPGVDGGDAISNLNPDNIESISVLKGATAAALYGSQAANGVIMITTKKGKDGATDISFSSNFTVDNPITIPDMQYTYGQTADGALDSWAYDKRGQILRGTLNRKEIGSFVEGDIIGLAIDLDNEDFRVYKNGTYVGGWGPHDGTDADLAQFHGVFPVVSSYQGNDTLKINCGQEPYALSTLPAGHQNLPINFDNVILDAGTVLTASSEYNSDGVVECLKNYGTDGYRSWASGSDDTQWIKIELPVARPVKAISIRASFATDRTPTAFTLHGSDTGGFTGEETLIHQETNTGTYSSDEIKTFTFSEVTFKYFKFTMTDKEGSFGKLAEYYI